MELKKHKIKAIKATPEIYGDDIVSIQICNSKISHNAKAVEDQPTGICEGHFSKCDYPCFVFLDI